jgi:DNA gyrase subunit A
VTNAGYTKRVPVSTYRAQRRGGKGRAGMATRDEDFVSQVYVANTHQPVLFFSSTGMVYKMKVYKLPVGTPQARGKALINLLPLDPGETITTTMALPEDEQGWDELFVMFATAIGNVRRNRLSDFTNVMANGKIAMKLLEGDSLVRVRTCSEDDDVTLATKGGKCIRFPVTDVRVFSGRTSVGVRGIRLKKGDEVIAMSILVHNKIDSDTRDAYLQAEHAARRLLSSEYEGRPEDKARDEELAARMAEPAFAELAENEQFILTVTADGYGKRSSAYEYRISGRGGQGITAISLDRPDGKADATVVSSFPVIDSDQVILVTNGGQIIRTPIDTVSIVGRTARGVRLFNVADDEDVVSVSRVREAVDDDEGSEDADPDAIGGDDAVAAGEEGAEGQSAESPEDMSEDAPEEGSGA